MGILRIRIKTMLITDVNFIKQMRIVAEDRSEKTMTLEGIFGEAEVRNQNRRRYTKPIMEREVKKLQPMILANRLCGELDHPQSEVVKLSNASHKILALEMRSNQVYGKIKLLSTPAGLTAQALVKDGVQLGISSRGLGTLTEEKDGYEVNEDFNMITYDLVADPSFANALPGISESRQLEINKMTKNKEVEVKFVEQLKEAITRNNKIERQFSEGHGDTNLKAMTRGFKARRKSPKDKRDDFSGKVKSIILKKKKESLTSEGSSGFKRAYRVAGNKIKKGEDPNKIASDPKGKFQGQSHMERHGKFLIRKGQQHNYGKNRLKIKEGSFEARVVKILKEGSMSKKALKRKYDADVKKKGTDQAAQKDREPIIRKMLFKIKDRKARM